METAHRVGCDATTTFDLKERAVDGVEREDDASRDTVLAVLGRVVVVVVAGDGGAGSARRRSDGVLGTSKTGVATVADDVSVPEDDDDEDDSVCDDADEDEADDGDDDDEDDDEGVEAAEEGESTLADRTLSTSTSSTIISFRQLTTILD
nr:hypothetical protein BaRGS_025812 [Batillaria attramentaria]